MQVSLRKMHIAPCRVSSDSMHIDCIIEDGVAEAVAKRFPAAAAEMALERVTRVTMRLRGVTAVGRSLRGAMIGAGAWRYRPLPPPLDRPAEARRPRARRS